MKRHLERGKLLPRDRVEMLLDAGSFFLEIAEVVLRIGARAMEKSTGETLSEGDRPDRAERAAFGDRIERGTV